jgi:hypothetical protein
VSLLSNNKEEIKMKRVVLIVRNLIGYTTNGNSRKVVSIISETNVGCPIYGKIEGTKYSQKEGGYLIYGSLDENLYIFENAGFEIVQIIRVN